MIQSECRTTIIQMRRGRLCLCDIELSARGLGRLAERPAAKEAKRSPGWKRSRRSRSANGKTTDTVMMNVFPNSISSFRTQVKLQHARGLFVIGRIFKEMRTADSHRHEPHLVPGAKEESIIRSNPSSEQRGGARIRFKPERHNTQQSTSHN
jgi:hypothetical protein